MMRAAEKTVEAPNPATTRGKVFKADHPRAIDSYIDYFGVRLVADVSPERNDPCGEGLLDALAAIDGTGGFYDRTGVPRGTRPA